MHARTLDTMTQLPSTARHRPRLWLKRVVAVVVGVPLADRL